VNQSPSHTYTQGMSVLYVGAEVVGRAGKPGSAGRHSRGTPGVAEA